jgi:hypothetical protein
MAGNVISGIVGGVQTAITIADILKKIVPHLIKDVDVINQRIDIPFDDHNAVVQKRYWVCGTTLDAVSQFVLGKILAKHIPDYRIILPDTTANTASRAQLKDMNKRTNPTTGSQSLPDQVKAAKAAYKDMSAILMAHPVKDIRDHLRRYNGVMYQNITIYDDIAYVSFYDASGIGAKNITLCCQKEKTPLFSRIEGFFEDMWKASM